MISPRWTSARSYAGQFPTWYFVLYFGCTLDFMSRSFTCRRYDGQEVDRGAPRARDPCTNATAGQCRGQIIDAVSIRERPAEAADRAVPGHWEGDLLTGARNSHIATLVERHSRFLLLIRLAGKDTANVVRALANAVRTLPKGLMASLTWDRGTEFASHKRFTVATNVKVYFCDPQSPWQRGTNENTNGLLRQYFPKGTNLSTYTQADLNTIAQRLNSRPRKTLGYATPADTLRPLLH